MMQAKRCEFCGTPLTAPTALQRFCTRRRGADGSWRRSSRCRQAAHAVDKASGTRAQLVDRIRHWRGQMQHKARRISGLERLVAKATAEIAALEADVDMLSSAIHGSTQAVLPFTRAQEGSTHGGDS